MNATLTSPFSLTALLLLATVSLPLLLALLLFPQRLRSTIEMLTPWAALPALGLALWCDPGMVVNVPGFLLGARFGVDTTAQVFLLFTSLLWISAGAYARAYLRADSTSPRFFGFFLATMGGNIGLILAQDMISFYLFFTLMSFAAYGLVIHDGSHDARYAGKVYLSLAVFGEALLIPGMLLIAHATNTTDLSSIAAGVAKAPTRNLIIVLLLAGFGIKAGALPLHVWLPLAHPVAPTPASAVLSGAMIKAGLLGWLRFLPLGETALPGWSSLCMVAGLIAAFYGVIVGLTQDNPKTVLAYSSISQMGFMTVGVGIGFSAPDAWPGTLTAIVLYALHHGLAKGALFLGGGVARSANQEGWRKRLIFVGLVLPALALAGAPLTSGAVAKLALKSVSVFPPAPWPSWILNVLPLAAVGTTLLMGRFLLLLRSATDAHGPQLTLRLWAPWAALIIGVYSLPWFFTSDTAGKTFMKTLSFSNLWPVLIGSLLSWTAWHWRDMAKKLVVRIPPGDLLSGIAWLWTHCQRIFRPLHATGTARQSLSRSLQELRQKLYSSLPLPRLEEWLATWTSAGIFFLALLIAAFSLLALQ